MGQAEVRVALPEAIAALLGDTPEAAGTRARRAIILDLLREGAISQGRAALLLGVSRHEILDLMALFHIPSGPATADELDREIAAIEGLSGAGN